MANKAYKLIAIAVAIIGAYLYFSNAYIYYRIGAAKLDSPDKRHAYQVAGSQTGKAMFYAALGDSLTSGVGTDKYEESYPYLLSAKMAEAGQTVSLGNYSYPGARTEDLIRDLLKPAIDAKPDMVTLLIGVNDIHGNVSLEDFTNNYSLILERLKLETKAKIYVISLPYIGSNTLILPPHNAYFKKRTIAFNRVIEELAAKYQAQYVNIYSPTFKIFEKDGPHYAPDAFHPSAVGYAIWSEIIYDRINR